MWACLIVYEIFVYSFGPIFFSFISCFFSLDFILVCVRETMFLLFLFGNCRHGCSDIPLKGEWCIWNRRSRRSMCNCFCVRYMYYYYIFYPYFLLLLLLFTLSYHSHKCLLLMGLFWYYSYLVHRLIHWHIAIFTCETDSLMFCVWNAVGSTELNQIPTTKQTQAHTHTHKHLALCECELFVCENSNNEKFGKSLR